MKAIASSTFGYFGVSLICLFLGFLISKTHVSLMLSNIDDPISFKLIQEWFHLSPSVYFLVFMYMLSLLVYILLRSFTVEDINYPFTGQGSSSPQQNILRPNSVASASFFLICVVFVATNLVIPLENSCINSSGLSCRFMILFTFVFVCVPFAFVHYCSEKLLNTSPKDSKWNSKKARQFPIRIFYPAILVCCMSFLLGWLIGDLSIGNLIIFVPFPSYSLH